MKPFAFLLLLTAACAKTETPAPAPPPAQPAGNAARGQQLIGQYGCNVCHIVPDFDGPQGSLGPSLAGVASRPTISLGTVPNTRANLVQFIQNPTSLNPQSAMTPVGVTPADAQDIVAFLLTLK